MTSHDDGGDDDGDDDDPFRFKTGLPFFCQVESDSRYELLCHLCVCTHHDDDDDGGGDDDDDDDDDDCKCGATSGLDGISRNKVRLFNPGNLTC